jgi:hypothetical protein
LLCAISTLTSLKSLRVEHCMSCSAIYGIVINMFFDSALISSDFVNLCKKLLDPEE